MSEPKTPTWRYVIPNAVTCTGMLIGLVSIMNTLAGHYETAAWMILLCTLIDKLDGTAARALNASSKFGVELDSFSDFLTFGIAPAILILGLLTKHPVYASSWDTSAGIWFVRGCCAFFIVMSALRLAKFNVLTEEIGSRLFLGIPTTLVGAITASWLLTVWKWELSDSLVTSLPFVMVALGLWMVSNIPLPKMRKTSSTPYNIWMGANAALAYILVPLQMLPDYLFFLAGGYSIIGTVYAIVFMREDNPKFRAVPHGAGHGETGSGGTDGG